MSVYKRGEIWWYKFDSQGKCIRESTGQSDKHVAIEAEAARKMELGPRQQRRASGSIKLHAVAR